MSKTATAKTQPPRSASRVSRHTAVLVKRGPEIEVEASSRLFDQPQRPDELIRRDESLAHTLRQLISHSKSLHRHLGDVLEADTPLQIHADYIHNQGFNKSQLASQLRSVDQRPFLPPSLTWPDKPSNTTGVERNLSQEANDALESLEQLTFPKSTSLSEAVKQTGELLEAIQALAAQKLWDLVRPEEMLDAQFFSYFDMLVEKMPHALLKHHFQDWIAAQEGRTFDSFVVKRELAAHIQQRLKRLNLRVECPLCEVPANFRCVQFGTSKTGQFGFCHRKGRSEVKHALSTAFPHVRLVPALKDPRIKVI